MILLLTSLRHQVLSGQELQHWVGGVGLFCSFGVFWGSLPSCANPDLWAGRLPQQGSWRAGQAMENLLECSSTAEEGLNCPEVSAERDLEDPFWVWGTKAALLVGLRMSSWPKLIFVCSPLWGACSAVRPSLLRNWKIALQKSRGRIAIKTSFPSKMFLLLPNSLISIIFLFCY